jgi:hypothetical protein
VRGCDVQVQLRSNVQAVFAAGKRTHAVRASRMVVYAAVRPRMPARTGGSYFIRSLLLPWELCIAPTPPSTTRTDDVTFARGRALQETIDVVREIISEQLGTDLDKVAPDAKFVDLGADSLDTVCGPPQSEQSRATSRASPGVWLGAYVVVALWWSCGTGRRSGVCCKVGGCA